MLDSLRSYPIPLWLAASFLVSVASSALSWRAQAWTSGPGALWGRWLPRLAAQPVLVGAGRFAYNIGLPYVALLAGALEARQAGLTGVDWGQTNLVAVAAVALFAYLWLDSRWRRSFNLPAVAPPADGTAVLLWNAAFQQAHWGFYRAGAIVLLDPYRGVFAGLGLVLLEWFLNPRWRAAWSDDARSARLAFDLALALTSAVLFAITSNFWLGASVHALCVVLLARRAAGAGEDFVQPGESAVDKHDLQRA